MQNENFQLDEQIQRMLTVGESVIWYGRPQKKCYVWDAILKMLPIAILWILFDGFFIFMMLSNRILKEVPFLIYIIIPFFLIHLAPVWIWIASIIKASKGYKKLTYCLTTERIILKSGLIGNDIRTISLESIDSINMREQVLDKMFHTGDIIIVGKNVSISLVDIEDFENVYKLFMTEWSEFKNHSEHQEDDFNNNTKNVSGIFRSGNSEF